MAHEIESMSYTNEVPWHGLGTYVQDAPNVEEILRLAKLDWEVRKLSIFANNTREGTELSIPDNFALMRMSDMKFLSIVGPRYRPVQNTKAFQFFKEFVEKGDATMETAGSLAGGKRVWGLANLKDSFTLAGGDKVNGYLLVMSPHEQGKSLLIKFTTVRVVCQNTLALALSVNGNKYTMRHTEDFGTYEMRKAKEVLGIAREQMHEFKERAQTLKKLTVRPEDVRAIFASLFQPQTPESDLVKSFKEVANPKLLRVMDIYQKAPGADPGTGWGVFNAVTYFTDHVAGKTSDARLLNAWVGKNADLKEKTLEMLLLRAS